MADNSERIINLIYKYLLETLSDAEREELEGWADQSPTNRELLSRLSDRESLADNYRKRMLVNPDKARNEMRRRIEMNSRKPAARYAYLSALAVAAIIALILIVAPTLRKTAVTPEPSADAIAQTDAFSIDSLDPGETMAYVVSDGRRIPVGKVDNVNGIAISELKKSKHGTDPVVLVVPRGGEFMVMLDDSTKVWLNSSSTLTYPDNFSSTSRRVKVTGEAYFAVTKDVKHNPFFVECDSQEIKVYGTEFNIRSYPEDEAVVTSLAKGSISVRRADGEGGELFISPGTQSVFNKKSLSAKVRNVNIETVTGWRHGRFVFEDQTLLQIMNDLGRWYDFEFEFKDPKLKEMIFMGSIPRYADFTTAMLILEKSGDVSFKTIGNKIIVDHKHP
ncbi:MAG: DUF4974 domain-containing protein [Muribaculaceae bacterium]|nr:DUF4974 domain-containing protein [Muribaculaceae bacterium]